jgi:hypothetical protein
MTARLNRLLFGLNGFARLVRRGGASLMSRTRLLVAVALAAVACLVAATAAGAVSATLTAAAVAAAAVILSVAAARFLSRRPAAAPHSQRSSSRSLVGTKRVLMLATIAGVIAYVGAQSTFSVFNAETANPGSLFGSGTLTMGNTVDSGTTCQSYNAATQDNSNGACDAVLALTNAAPGVTSGQAKLTIEDTGSLDASKFYVSAPYPRTNLSGALTSGNPVSTLAVGGFDLAVSGGDQITVSFGGHTQTFTASSGASAGATSISVTSVAANYSYPVGSRVEETSTNTTAANTECFDAKTTSSPVAGATYGTQLNFNSTTDNPLCSSLLFWVQEQTNGNNYCWYGLGSSASASPSAIGQCRTPTTATLSSTLTAGVPTTSLPVSALSGNVKSGDSIVVTQGSNTQTFTASSAAFIGDTSISISSATPGYSYTSAATVQDSTAFGALDGDTTDTISAFDTGHPQTNRIELHPLTGNGTADSLAAVELNKHGDSGSSRVFYVGVYMPSSGTNLLQGLQSTFGLDWHIDQ